MNYLHLLWAMIESSSEKFERVRKWKLWKAPAKINLGLDILGKRPDGLHELAMVMVNIDLADRLYLEEIPENKIIIETNKAFLPTDKKNHVYEVLELVRERFEIKQGLRVKIHKEIPVAAGLGGG